MQEDVGSNPVRISDSFLFTDIRKAYTVVYTYIGVRAKLKKIFLKYLHLRIYGESQLLSDSLCDARCQIDDCVDPIC